MCGTAEVTLLLGDVGFPHIGKKPRVSGAAPYVVRARFVEAQGAIDGVADISGIRIILAIVFPPADGAKCHGRRRLEGPVAAAGTAIEHSRGFHDWMDEKRIARITRRAVSSLWSGNW
jgi:hypothetical protein